MTQLFRAFDGTEFALEESCRVYERELKVETLARLVECAICGADDLLELGGMDPEVYDGYLIYTGEAELELLDALGEKDVQSDTYLLLEVGRYDSLEYYLTNYYKLRRHVNAVLWKVDNAIAHHMNA